MEERQYEMIADHIHAFIYTVDRDTFEITYANQMTRALFGISGENPICYRLIFDRESPCTGCPMQQLSDSQPSAQVCVHMEKIGCWVHLEYNDCLMEDGTRLCICTGLDVSDSMESAHQTEKVLNGIRAAAYTVGQKDYRLRFMNQELRNMLPGVRVGDFCYEALWENDRPCPHCPLPHLNEQQPCGNMELYNEKLRRYLSIDSVRVMENGEPVVIFTGYDITRRMEYEVKLKNMAYKDLLLGIKNRNAFMDDLAGLLEERQTGTVCITNLKNFTSYNLVYGRQFGDQLLKSMTDYYAQRYRKERIYRVGGAKLALLAVGDQETAELKAMLDARVPMERQDTQFRIFSDAVLVEFPRFAASPEVLIHNAEYLLRKSKKRDSSEVFSFQMREQSQMERNNEILAIIRREIERSGFQVYYQPIYSVADADFPKCEALLRLYDKNLGWISPAEFIPLAEESGLINELGDFVLDTVCRLLHTRRAQGMPPIQVNVNLSTIQFSQKGFFEHTMAILDQYTLDLAQIQFEMTESVIIHSFESITYVMRQFIERGLSFAVDDFGTGYSSLSYIGTLPVKSLKLDKSFIDRITESEVYLLIVKNVIEIAKGLHFKVVAEGVEEQGQFELLKRLGCDYIQGYLFSKPLPPDDFTVFLQY